MFPHKTGTPSVSEKRPTMGNEPHFLKVSKGRHLKKTTTAPRPPLTPLEVLDHMETPFVEKRFNMKLVTVKTWTPIRLFQRGIPSYHVPNKSRFDVRKILSPLKDQGFQT